MKATTSVRLLWSLFALLGLVLATREWVWIPTLISGASMEPTLPHRELVGVNKLAYAFSRPRRGDVVAVWTGKGLMIKRVIGLPGETITLRQGKFYVDGTELAEPYVKFNESSTIASGQLGADRLVVAGDNRAETVIAVIKRDRIVGRVIR